MSKTNGSLVHDQEGFAGRDEALAALVTVRDWLRFATSAFTAAQLSFGHGSTRAVDEAAFLILETLHLPIDALDPWHDAKLLTAERGRLYDIVQARITTRKPASYLTGTAYIQSYRFKADERAIVPRSYIGELLCAGTITNLLDDRTPAKVLDLCTGGGSLAIIAAMTFPQAVVTATDVSAEALGLARENVVAYDLEKRITLRQGDLFAAVGRTRFDLIIANPPYVAREEVDAFAPEYQAEPQLAHLGGETGLDLVDRILTKAMDHLTPEGVIVVEVGTGRALIEDRYPDLPLLWLDTEESEGEVLAMDGRDLS